MSRSPTNPNAHLNRGCVEAERGDTGKGFKAIMAYLTHASPPCVILENVTPLGEKNDDGDSDAAFILSDLRRIGYTSRVHTVMADEYGSLVPRARLYFVAMKSVHSEVSIDDAYPSILTAMRVPKFDCAKFIDSATEDVERNLNKLGISRIACASSGKHAKVDPDFKTEHYEFYKDQSLSWPPDVSKGPWVSLNITRRQKEVAFFAACQFPGDRGSSDFLDVNLSLGRLVGTGKAPIEAEDTKPVLKNPWHKHPMTLTCHTLWLLRKTGFDANITLRVLEGHELMRLIGWCDEHWRVQVPRGGRSGQVLRDLAGNAFSGFACGPIAAATLACARFGALQEQETAGGISRADSTDDLYSSSSDS